VIVTPLVQVLTPIALATLAFAIPAGRARPWLLPIAGLGHIAMTVVALSTGYDPGSGGWLVLDPVARPALLLISLLFLACSFYAVGFLRHWPQRPNRVFCACLLVLLGTMTLVVWSRHLGLMWVAIEATTLSAAPLIYFHHNARSLEATWKYLLVGSVGIALALLGSFFLAYASFHEGLVPSLGLQDLLHQAPRLNKPWLHAAFVLLLVGYGTKMGLAPLHTWKPDAYGEAPGVVGALLAGGLTTCAFLAILRIYHICAAAGEATYAGRLLVLMGLVSMAFAGVFMVGQRDFKRMLAYSSVEHMGILVLGVGLGGPALFGALLHLVNNGLTKGVMFLSAGNIQRAFDDKTIEHARGAIHRLPLSGSLFLAGFLAVTGSPPFGPFVSEFTIISAAFGAHRYWVGALFLLFLMIVFIGMGATVLTVVQGRPDAGAKRTNYRDGLLTGLLPLVMMLLVLMLGLYIPTPLGDMLREAARFLEARP
jgi:hydrogenase-4 component F